MLKLIPKYTEAAERHSKVPAKRREQLVGFLEKTDPDHLPKVVETFRRNSIPAVEMALVEEVLGITQPPPPPPAGKTTPATDTK